MTTNAFVDWLVQQFVQERAEHRFCVGRLLDNASVRQRAVDLELWMADHIQTGFLVAQVAPGLWSLLRDGEPVEKQFYALEPRPDGADGVHVLVFSMRCDEWEHRCVLPLVGEGAALLLDGMTKAAVGLSLSSPGQPGEVMTYVDVRAYAEELLQLPVVSRTRDAAVLAGSLVGVTRYLFDAHPPSTAASVRRLCVTLVLGDEVLAGLDRAFRRASGAQ